MLSDKETERYRRLWVGMLLNMAGTIQAAEKVEEFPQVVRGLRVVADDIHKKIGEHASSIGAPLEWE